MDEVSIRILRLLERDASLSNAQIATMLGVSSDEIDERLDDLVKSRVILGRKAVINWERTREEPVIALIEIRVSPQRDVGFGAIAARIARFPEARSVTLVSGTYDLSVEVVGTTMKEVASFVSEKLAPLDGVQGTTTHFMLRRFKLDGEMFGEPDSDARLPYAP